MGTSWMTVWISNGLQSEKTGATKLRFIRGPGVHRPLAAWLPPPASPIDSGCTACRGSVRALVTGPPSIPRAPYT